MSYILEALRKADAERDRGSVPDLHAQLLPQGVSDMQTEPARAPLLPWLVVGALLAVVAGGAWYVLGRDADGVVAAPAPAASGAVAAAVPASAASAPAVPPSAPAGASAPAPVGAASAPVPRARPVAKRTTAEGSAKAVAPKAVARPPAPPPPAPPAPAPAPAPAVRLPGLGELPGELRQQVPPLVIGGSVYSPQASARMVIVNGQVFQEGASLTPELKLEQVRPKAAVFSIRGQLFEVPF